MKYVIVLSFLFSISSLFAQHETLVTIGDAQSEKYENVDFEIVENQFHVYHQPTLDYDRRILHDTYEILSIDKVASSTVYKMKDAKHGLIFTMYVDNHNITIYDKYMNPYKQYSYTWIGKDLILE